jgi:hypothetical protein
VGEYLAYWLSDVVQPFRRATTYDSYETMIRLHIVPYIGRKRLDRLAVADGASVRERFGRRVASGAGER